MCRSVIARTYPNDWDRLKIRAFHLRFFFSGSGVGRRVPEAVTLVYLPRISASVLEINGSKVKPDASAFLALHRVRSAEPPGTAGGSMEAVYASTDRVRAGDGVRFEVYIGAEKALKGVFRRGGGEGRGWRMECTCAAEGELEASVETAEVCIAGEGGAAMVERVKLSARRNRRRRLFCLRLEEIPEEWDGCDCTCCDADEEEDEHGKWEMVRLDGQTWGEESGTNGDDVLEVDLEGVRWAVDLGIWAVCLGVGFLVSKASYRGLRKKSLF